MWAQVGRSRHVRRAVQAPRVARVWHKLLAAPAHAIRPVGAHAVCSARTQSQHDPGSTCCGDDAGVRGSVGGAQLITRCRLTRRSPASPLGRESRATPHSCCARRASSPVIDAAGGAYYIELAPISSRARRGRGSRAGRDGGVCAALQSGSCASASGQRGPSAVAIASARTRAGVSEFANLDELLPAPVPRRSRSLRTRAARASDAEGFDALRVRRPHRGECTRDADRPRASRSGQLCTRSSRPLACERASRPRHARRARLSVWQ